MKSSVVGKNALQKSCISAVCLALCLVLPFLTGQIPQIGSALSPMHIPVLLCGFLCGWPYGLVIGLIAPPLRFLLFSMPPIMTTGLGRMFELAAYGALAGILYRYLPKKLPYLYVSLIGAMLGGRVVWGIARFVIAKLFSLEFGFAMFLTAGFVTAVPGIILHILIIPPIVYALRRAKVVPAEI